MSSLNEVMELARKELKPRGAFKSYMNHEATMALVSHIKKEPALWDEKHPLFNDHLFVFACWNSILDRMHEEGHEDLDWAVKSWQNIRCEYVSGAFTRWYTNDHVLYRSLRFMGDQTFQANGDVITQDDLNEMTIIQKYYNTETKSGETFWNAVKEHVRGKLLPQGVFSTYLSHDATMSLVSLVKNEPALWDEKNDQFNDDLFVFACWNSILNSMHKEGHKKLDYAVKSWRNIRCIYSRVGNCYHAVSSRWSSNEHELYRSLKFLQNQIFQAKGAVITQDDLNKMIIIHKYYNRDAKSSEQLTVELPEPLKLRISRKQQKPTNGEAKTACSDESNSHERDNEQNECLDKLVKEVRELKTELTKQPTPKELIVEALKEFEEQKKVQQNKEKKKVSKAAEKLNQLVEERNMKMEENRAKESQKPEDWTEEKEKETLTTREHKNDNLGEGLFAQFSEFSGGILDLLLDMLVKVGREAHQKFINEQKEKDDHDEFPEYPEEAIKTLADYLSKMGKLSNNNAKYEKNESNENSGPKKESSKTESNEKDMLNPLISMFDTMFNNLKKIEPKSNNVPLSQKSDASLKEDFFQLLGSVTDMGKQFTERLQQEQAKNIGATGSETNHDGKNTVEAMVSMMDDLFSFNNVRTNSEETKENKTDIHDVLASLQSSLLEQFSNKKESFKEKLNETQMESGQSDQYSSIKSVNAPLPTVKEPVPVKNSIEQEKAKSLSNITASLLRCKLCNKDHKTWAELKAHKEICHLSEKVITKEAREQTNMESVEERMKQIKAHIKAKIEAAETEWELDETLKSEGVEQSKITVSEEEGIKSKKVRWFIGPKTEITVAKEEVEKANVAVQKAAVAVEKAHVAEKINKEEEIQKTTSGSTKEEIGVKPETVSADVLPTPRSFIDRRCDICNKMYSTESVLRDHKKHMHGIYEVKQVQEFPKTPKYETYEKLGHRCDICYIKVDSYFALAGHKQIIHGIMPNGSKANKKSATTGFGGIKKTTKQPETEKEIREMVEKIMLQHEATLDEHMNTGAAMGQESEAEVNEKDLQEKKTNAEQIAVTKKEEIVTVIVATAETTAISKETRTVPETLKEELTVDEQATVTQEPTPVTVTQVKNTEVTKKTTSTTATAKQTPTTVSRSGQDDYLTFCQFFVFIFPAIMIIVLLNFC